jgi:hypothetical protein
MTQKNCAVNVFDERTVVLAVLDRDSQAGLLQDVTKTSRFD